MTVIESLRARLAQIAGDIAALTAAAEAENQRPLTQDESEKFNTLDQEFRTVEASITSYERSEEIQTRLGREQPRAAAPAPMPAPGERVAITGGNKVAHGFDNHGFRQGIGEYFLSVRAARVHNKLDPRLMVNAITTFGGETVGADGGYALPPQFAREIMQQVMPEDSFLRALNPVTSSSNLITIPTDEDPPWGTSGVTAAKTAEGGTITASKPALKKVQIVMHAIKSLVHVSEESLSDIPFLATYVQNKMAEKIRYKMEDYAVNGTGMDEPLGFLNAPGLLALADADSTATSIGAIDVFGMKAATLAGGSAFWIVNPTVLPAIWALKSDATAGYPLFTPDMTKAPEGMLLGLPMFRSESSKILNTTGDIMLIVPSGYVLVTAGQVNAVTTIAFAFDQDLQSFKATLRMGGAPTLSARVSRAASSTSYASHIIALTGSRS